MLFVDVEIENRPGHCVRVVDGVITFVGPRSGTTPVRDGSVIVDGRGGALIPGLHDHHLHLLSQAARSTSLCCGSPAVFDRATLVRVLRAAAESAVPGEWVRGYGYDDAIAGPLTAAAIDDLLGDRRGTPVRIQHRGGHQWMLNGAALAAIGPATAHAAAEAGVVRDADRRLRDRWPPVTLRLDEVGSRLARYGVTGVTDATVSNGPPEREMVASAQAAGALRQRVLMLGDMPAGAVSPFLGTGARKLVLAEDDLPALEDLEAAIAGGGRGGVAIHCVSREAVVLAAVALSRAGAPAGGGRHRLEHAGVAPPEVVALLRGLPVTVVTQPGFIDEHGDRYLRDVDEADLPWLYRLRAWKDAGVPLAAGTDAPFGTLDPWAAMRAAVTRTTRAGVALGTAERLRAHEALALFLSPLRDPGGPPRRVTVGSVADLCLLSAPWHEVRRSLDHRLVRATYVGGRPIWTADGDLPQSA